MTTGVEKLIRGAIDETRELVAALPEELFELRDACRIADRYFACLHTDPEQASYLEAEYLKVRGKG